MGLMLHAAPSVEPISLIEAKAHLRVDHSTDDTLITASIVAARAAAENFCQRALITQQWKKTLDFFPCGITLPMPPVQSVVSLKYYDTNGVQQTLDSLTYTLDVMNEPGRLVPAYGLTWPATRDIPNTVEVIYKAGYGDAAVNVPGPIKAWILLKIAELYEYREASAERAAVPHEFVDHLLWPYRVVRF